MAMKVSDLFADLSLRTTKFSEGMEEAVSIARKAGTEMEDAFGKRPKKALQDTEKQAARTTWAIRGYVKDTARVVTGILISQAFYTLLRTIRESISAVWELTSSLEQAAVQFKYLLGDERAAKALIKELRDFATETPFNIEESVSAARYLLAAGFDLRQIMPIMEGLTDVTAATGTDLFRIADIFGQIRSEGRLTAMTMRRLQKMAIPVTHILQEELGLTRDQIINIGREAIPAGVAIQALLTGWQKRFAGAAKEVERTLKGITNRIKDNLMIIGSAAFKPLFDSWKNFAENLLTRLDSIRQGIDKIGRAHLLEALVPPELHTTIRVIIAALGSLWESLKMIGQALKPVISALGEWFVRALAAVLPVLAGVVRVLAQLFVWATQSSPVIRVLVGAIVGLLISSSVAAAVGLLTLAIKKLGIAHAVGAAVGFLARAIKVLYIALTEHPIVALITILVAAFIGLALSIKSVSDWLDRMMKRLSSFFGFNLDDILKPMDPEDLSDALSGISDSFEDIVEDAEEAGNAIKNTFIASFDEVYPVPDALDNIGVALGKIPDLGWDFGGGDSAGDVEEQIEDSSKAFEEAKKRFAIPPEWFNWIPALVPMLVPLIQGVKDLAYAWELLKEKVHIPVKELELETDEVERVVREGLQERLPQTVGKAIRTVLELLFPVPMALLRPFVEWLDELIPKVRKAFQTEIPQEIEEGLTTSIPQAIARGLLVVLRLLFPFPMQALEPFAKWISDTVAEIQKGFQTDLPQVLQEGLLTILRILFPFSPAAIQPIIDWIRGTNEEVEEGLQKEAPKKVELGLADIIKALVPLPLRGLIPVAEWISDSVKEIKRGFQTDAPGMVDLGLKAILRVLIPFPIAADKPLTEWVADGLARAKEWGGKISKTLEEHKGPILLIVAGIILAIILAFAGVPAGVAGALAGIVLLVGGIFGNVKTAVAAETDETKRDTVSKWTEVRLKMAELWESIRRSASEKWTAIKNTIRDNINIAIDFVNKFIRAWNAISFNVPKIDLGPLGSLGGGTIGLPRIGEIPRLQHGGIIPEEMLVRAGEHGKEAIVPLTGEDARPFARAIASEFASLMPAAGSEQQPVYVGTLIADERGLRELERRMRVIRIKEDRRVGQV